MCEPEAAFNLIMSRLKQETIEFQRITEKNLKTKNWEIGGMVHFLKNGN